MCQATSKVFLLVLNGILVFFSLVCLVAGIVVAVKSHAAADFIPEGHGQLKGAAIIFIIASIVSILFSICGFLGALKENKVMLISYSIGLGVLILIQLVVIILVATYGNKIGDKLQEAMKEQVRDFFLPYDRLNTANSHDRTVIFRNFQLSFKCCGVTDYTDITNNGTAWSKASPQFNHTSMKVPASCCKFTNEGIDKLMAATDWSDFAKYRVSGSQCPMKLQNFNNQGCYDIVLGQYKGLVAFMIVFCTIFSVVCIICIIMAAYLIYKHQLEQGKQ